MDTIYIAVVDESDYPVFRRIGDANEFPQDFGAFVRRVERHKTDYHELGYRIREVNVDPAGFKQQLRIGKRATYADLTKYAARIVKGKRRPMRST